MSLDEGTSNRFNDNNSANEAEDTISPNIGLQLIKKVLITSFLFSYIDK